MDAKWDYLKEILIYTPQMFFYFWCSSCNIASTFFRGCSPYVG